MNMFHVIQKENKDLQTTAGEKGANGYVHDCVRVRGSWKVDFSELPLIVILVKEMGVLWRTRWRKWVAVLEW